MANEEPDKLPATANGAADEEDEDTPPGFPSSSASADQLAEDVSKVTVDGEAPDEPDLALRLLEGLQESDKEIKTDVKDDTIYKAAAAFEDLPISKELLQGLYTEMKFERPSRIQALTLPMILTPDASGTFRDLIAQAHNGSGKTTCFVLAMLSRVNPAVPEPQALCMCPTRELVVQNLLVLQRMAKYTGIKATSTASDMPKGVKIREQVVIGTHGKLKNWVTQRQLAPDNVQILVFDEADEMLKAEAFADDSVRLIKMLRKKNPSVQLLLFSATFNDRIKAFAVKIAPNANMVFVPKEDLSLDVISQYNVRVPLPDQRDRMMMERINDNKAKVLKDMIFPNCEKLGQTIIFVRTRDGARRLHQLMEKEGHKCTSIEGGMQPEDRDRVVKEFREGVTKILISTDVLSRGFDVSQVTLVVNFDLPVERDQQRPAFDTYLHRIGRSGRFGRKGAAFNLICGGQDDTIMRSIAEYFRKDIPDVPWDDEDAFIGVLNKAGLTDQAAT